MIYEQNVRAILESNFAGSKDEIVDIAVRNIMALSENKGDLISRGEVENVLHNNLHALIDTDQLYQLYKDINRLPTYPIPNSAENKGEWIPVSERLPLLRGSYQISDDVLITNGYEIDMGYLVERKGKIFWHYYGGDFEVGIKDEDNDAIAWMPLPEPYKTEKGGE